MTNTPVTLDLCQTVANTMEAQVLKGHYTAWSVKLPNLRMSAYFTDEWSPYRRSRYFNVENLHPSFDLASLTKPFFLPLLIKLGLTSFQKEHLCIPFSDLFRVPTFNDSHALNLFQRTNSSATLLDLLNHNAGFKAWNWMGKCAWHFGPDKTNAIAHVLGQSIESQKHRRNFLTDLCFLGHDAPLKSSTRTAPNKTIYSDLGYCVLAALVEESQHFKGWKLSLKELNETLGTQFSHASIPLPTVLKPVPFFPYLSFESEKTNALFNHHEDFGPIQDTNANILANLPTPLVSGHAGLIGNIVDCENALLHVINTHTNWASAADRFPTTRFQLGLDTVETLQSTAGIPSLEYSREEGIVGHLGYTGTSFWASQLDPAKSSIVLTNRTARRAAFGTSAPRILVTELTQGALTKRWVKILRHDGKETEIGLEDAAELCHEETEDRSLVWSHNMLHAPANLSDLRRAIHQLTW